MGNILLIIFVIALTALYIWWAFNAIKQIQSQKEFAALPLTSIAKLWRKAKFVPEDAKDRESLYLYRDFLTKFSAEECKFPIVAKNGGVRCMTRKEYDHLCQQKPIKPVSIIMCALSFIYAVVAIALNTDNILLGLGMALIVPALQVILAIFIVKFNKDKNKYRDGLFDQLKENSVDFLRIAKPFIMVDAYPKEFGKNTDPKFVGNGKLTPEQIEETKAYITRQRQAETKVVMQPVNQPTPISTTIAEEPATPTVPIIPDVVSEVPTPVTPIVNETETPSAPIVSPVNPVINSVTDDFATDKQKADDLMTEMLFNHVNKEKDNQPIPAPQPQIQPQPIETPVVPMQPVAPTPMSTIQPMAVDNNNNQAGQLLNTTTPQQPQPIETPVMPAASVTPETPITPVTSINSINPTNPDIPETPADNGGNTNDFSLDSIGVALDAEIAKRRNAQLNN